jgi:hypothetical protein
MGAIVRTVRSNLSQDPLDRKVVRLPADCLDRAEVTPVGTAQRVHLANVPDVVPGGPWKKVDAGKWNVFRRHDRRPAGTGGDLAARKLECQVDDGFWRARAFERRKKLQQCGLAPVHHDVVNRPMGGDFPV